MFELTVQVGARPRWNAAVFYRQIYLSIMLLASAAMSVSVSAQSPEVVLTDAERSLLRAFGPWGSPPPPDPGNELSGHRWAEVLGQQLFLDPDLSGDRSMSCASCHRPDRGFDDGLAVAQGAAAHVRNTQSLWNVGYQRWFGWDGGGDSLWSAALRPMLSEIEMASDVPTLARRLRGKDYFNVALGTAGYLASDLNDSERVVLAAKSIGAYTRTLVSAKTPFDHFRESVLRSNEMAEVNYSSAARRGLKIFLGPANCHVCHFGPNFSNREFHDTGRPFFTDVGQVDPGRYTGIQRVRDDRYNLAGPFNGTDKAQEIRKTRSVKLNQSNFGQWRTPSLRNLVSTAPYTHDGSLATLRDVVDAYADIDPQRLHANGEAILKPLGLSEQDREDLVAFLKTLSVD